MSGFHFQRLRDAQRTRTVVERVEQATSGRLDDERPSHLRRYQIIFEEDLAAADDPDTPSSAMATFKAGLASSDALADSPAPTSHRVYNRSTKTSFETGDYAFAVEVDEDDRWYVLPSASTGGGGGGCCDCTCLTDGDIIVDGYETSSQWTVPLPTVSLEVEHGTLSVPSGEYVVEWDEGLGYWLLDVTDDVTAAYGDGEDATEDLESDVAAEIRFYHDDGGGWMKVEVTLDGSVPNQVQSFDEAFSDDFE